MVIVENLFFFIYFLCLKINTKLGNILLTIYYIEK